MKTNNSNIQEFRQRLSPKIMPGSISVKKCMFITKCPKIIGIGFCKEHTHFIEIFSSQIDWDVIQKMKGILLRENRVLLALNKITVLTVCVKNDCIEEQAKDKQHKK